MLLVVYAANFTVRPSILRKSSLSKGDGPGSILPLILYSPFKSFNINSGFFLAAYCSVSTQTEFEISV